MGRVKWETFLCPNPSAGVVTSPGSNLGPALARYRSPGPGGKVPTFVVVLGALGEDVLAATRRVRAVVMRLEESGPELRFGHLVGHVLFVLPLNGRVRLEHGGHDFGGQVVEDAPVAAVRLRFDVGLQTERKNSAPQNAFNEVSETKTFWDLRCDDTDGHSFSLGLKARSFVGVQPHRRQA